jgi:pyruvate dehydrogenase E2 component (dihydrolipoamide acetyltransferase)
MATVIEMPALSSTMKKGKVVKWCKKEGDSVEKGEILYEVETDKVNVEVESLASGYLRKILVREDIEVPVNTPIAIITVSMDEDISAVVEAGPLPEVSPPKEESEIKIERKRKKMPKVKISPLARKIAEEQGIDPETLQGTGPGGRVTKQDVEKAVAAKSQVPADLGKVGAGKEVLPDIKDKDIPLTKMRRVIAQRLQESKVTAPHFYVDVTADASALTQLKEAIDENLKKDGGKVSFNDLLIKILSHALQEYPMVNVSMYEDHIRVHGAINIGVAVEVEDGLVVPVLRNADQKTISEIGREVAELVDKARNKRLLPDEYQGGTFTITNLGMFGVETFHAIINPPEGGILAVSAIIPKPVVVDGEIAVRPCLKLSLSVDHRVVDGALAARFLARMKELVEAPFSMFLSV